jgi:cell division protein FtsQ
MNERRAQPPKRSPRATAARVPRFYARFEMPLPIRRVLRRAVAPLRGVEPPRGAGVVAAAALVVASIGYGAVKGDHVAVIVAGLQDARDATANAAGFGIHELSIAGRRQLSESEVLAAAGVTERTSLLFLDVEATRGRLTSTPWIAEATVQKLYPGRLQIEIRERDAFALWQKEGQVSVISADGTILGPFADRRFAALPFVVGPGAGKRARDFLGVLDRYPTIRAQVRASILVADRRWNLKLKNGIDVRLPETDPAGALDVLAGLDRDKKLLTRDITAVDLRLPDRVTVRLSDTAAQAREELLRPKKGKRKGGDA